jgi:hypothetical protein
VVLRHLGRCLIMDANEWNGRAHKSRLTSPLSRMGEAVGCWRPDARRRSGDVSGACETPIVGLLKPVHHPSTLMIGRLGPRNPALRVGAVRCSDGNRPTPKRSQTRDDSIDATSERVGGSAEAVGMRDVGSSQVGGRQHTRGARRPPRVPCV